MKTTVWLMVAALVSVQAHADEAEPTAPVTEVALQQVTVTGSPSQPFKPYRAMFPGLKAYARLQASLGPQSQLRFRITNKTDANPFSPPPASLKVILQGPETSTVLALDAKGEFELPLSQTFYDEDFDIVLNPQPQAYGWRPDVRSPDVPQNARRLGDLRLECAVNMEINKGEMGFVERAALSAIALGGDWCSINSKGVRYGFAAPQTLASAKIVDKDRRMPLHASGYFFDAPIADKSWSNDALIELEFATP